MAGKTLETGKAAIEILKMFPKSSESSLARKLCADNPLLFTCITHARNTIRFHNGKRSGGQGRKKNPIITESLHTRENPYGLPNSDYEEFHPLVIPPSVKNLLIGSDFHFLFQDNRAISKWMDYGIGQKVGGILLNGDVMDMYQVSRFLKKPSISDIQREFEDVRNFLVMLRKKFPNIPIYYKEGNHEERWELNLRINSPMLFKMDEFQLATILRLAELNIDFITDKRIVKYC